MTAIDRDGYDAIDPKELTIKNHKKESADLTDDFGEGLVYIKNIIDAFREKSEILETEQYNDVINNLVIQFNNLYIQIINLGKSFGVNPQIYNQNKRRIKNTFDLFVGDIKKGTDSQNVLTVLNNLKMEYLEYIIENNNLGAKEREAQALIEKLTIKGTTLEELTEKLSEKGRIIDQEGKKKGLLNLNMDTGKLIVRYLRERLISLALALITSVIIICYALNQFAQSDVVAEKEILLEKNYGTGSIIVVPINLSEREISDLFINNYTEFTIRDLYIAFRQLLIFSVLFYLLSLFVNQYKVSSNLFVSYSQKQSMLDVYPLIIDVMPDSDEKEKINYKTTEIVVEGFISENESYMYSKKDNKDLGYKSLVETLINKLPLGGNNT